MADCTDEQVTQGTKSAIQRNDVLEANGGKDARIEHAKVDVTIKKVTADAVILTTSAEDNIRREYQIERSLVWLDCPSQARKAGDVGFLYISRKGLAVTSNDADKVRIYGSTPDCNGNTLLKIKWPDSGGVEVTASVDVKPLSIWPTSIVVKGYAVDDPVFHHGTVELLDAHVAGFHQAIQLSRGADITLLLTPRGLGEFHMSGDHLHDLRRAVALVTSPFHDDAEARVEAWRVVARCQRYLDWCKGSGNKIAHGVVDAIESTLSLLVQK
jgi:hypothetical protein